jgi:hypothetical protein
MKTAFSCFPPVHRADQRVDSGCLTEFGEKPADALCARPAPRETGRPRAAPLSLA